MNNLVSLLQVAVKLILLPMSKVSSAYDHIGCIGLFILQCLKMTVKLDERFMLIQVQELKYLKVKCIKSLYNNLQLKF